MSMAILMDIVLAVLLGATCLYCVVLNRRLRTLKTGQEELQTAISVFDKAAANISATLERLEHVGLDHTRDIDRSLDKANEMAAELSVMVSAGDNIADRLERVVNEVRAIGVRRSNPTLEASAPLEKCA